MARDHGGGIDAAVARFGGTRSGWIDLSTGINPQPYPVTITGADAWTALPDRAATDRLITAARAFWQVPATAAVVVAPGASALIARMPGLAPGARAYIPAPTYNEHAAAFAAATGQTDFSAPPAPAQIQVHPNNPDGRLFPAACTAALTVIDESFCDIMPDASRVGETAQPGVVVLKSFGKFWGLAGLRLGFAICAPQLAQRLAEALGPWPVSGPALEIGARALADPGWADATRARLTRDAARLDALLARHGTLVGGTSLFRLYRVPDARALQYRLAQRHIWSRVFPYAQDWIRLGLPHPDHWARLEAAL